jgi:HNH endonuclease
VDAQQVLEQFHDYLAPKLDTYEQAIYLYVLRHSRLQGLDEVVVGFKSARRRIALGIGEKGKPMAEKTCYDKLRSLQAKGCLQVVASEQSGTRLRLRPPSEIDGLVVATVDDVAVGIEELDFFSIPEYRLAILLREANRCAYCLRAIDASNYVIEHIASRPAGDNSYRNLVAACRGCNNRKGKSPAEDFLRLLYREGLLSSADLQTRLDVLERVQRGELKPRLPASDRR